MFEVLNVLSLVQCTAQARFPFNIVRLVDAFPIAARLFSPLLQPQNKHFIIQYLRSRATVSKADMHRFRDMTTCWSKIAEKTYPTLIWHVPLGWPLAYSSTTHTFQKLESSSLESWGYQMVYISRSCFRSARHNTGVWQTDGQTDRQIDTSLSQRPR